MNEKQATPNEQSPQTDSNLNPLPNGSSECPAGLAGSAGIPVAANAHAPDNKPEYQAPLPGFEEYFPKGPIELDNSTKSLTEEAKALLDKCDKERASRKGACINV